MNNVSCELHKQIYIYILHEEQTKHITVETNEYITHGEQTKNITVETDEYIIIYCSRTNKYCTKTERIIKTKVVKTKDRGRLGDEPFVADGVEGLGIALGHLVDASGVEEAVARREINLVAVVTGIGTEHSDGSGLDRILTGASGTGRRQSNGARSVSVNDDDVILRRQDHIRLNNSDRLVSNKMFLDVSIDQRCQMIHGSLLHSIQ